MKTLIYKLQKRLIRTSENNINYSNMKKMLKDNPQIIVLDVRTRDEYIEKHLDNAINIPMHEIDRKIEKVVKDRNEVIIVYCQYGGRSRKVSNKLKKMGYVNVYNLEGGIKAVST